MRTNRSTASAPNIRSLQQQVRTLQQATSNVVKTSSCSADPPAITNNGVWITRKVYVERGVAANLTIGDISTALRASNNVGATGDFYITRISGWGTYGSGLDNSLSFNISLTNLTSTGRAAGGSDQIFSRDLGTGTRRPGVRVDIPRTIALLQSWDTAATTAVLNSITNGAEFHVTVMQLI